MEIEVFGVSLEWDKEQATLTNKEKKAEVEVWHL